MTHLLQIWQGLVPCRSHHDPLVGQEGEEILGTWGFGKLKRGHSLRITEENRDLPLKQRRKVPLARTPIPLSKLNCMLNNLP